MARVPKPSGNKKRDVKRGRRAVGSVELRPRFLIVCEGEETEVNYFRSFQVNVKVKPVGTGLNTISLVEKAKKIRDYDGEYTDVWVVFDLDDYLPQDFNKAIDQAKQDGMYPAYSNEAFELWFLLHFQSMIGNTITRPQYYEILSRKLGKAYDKADRALYQDLLKYRGTAIENANALMQEYEENHNPAQDKPCTTVHKLVQALIEHER